MKNVKKLSLFFFIKRYLLNKEKHKNIQKNISKMKKGAKKMIFTQIKKKKK